MLGSPRPRAAREETAITKTRRWSALLSLVPLFAAVGGGVHAAEPRTYGTGFLIRPDGWLLTSAQVAKDARALAVTCPDRPKVAAMVDHLVPRLDVAVLRIPQESLPYLTLSLSISVDEVVRVGDTVATVVYLNAPGAKPAVRPRCGDGDRARGAGQCPGVFPARDARRPSRSGRPRGGQPRRGHRHPHDPRRDARAISTPPTPPAPNVTWTVKAQAVRPLFVAPPPQPMTRSLEEAIERTRKATCLIEITR